MPGFSPRWLTYVRQLSSRNEEIAGSAGTPRRRRFSTPKGVTPRYAAPSWVSTSSSPGTCSRSASSSTSQCAKSNSVHVCAISQPPGGSGQGRWSASRSVPACRAGARSSSNGSLTPTRARSVPAAAAEAAEREPDQDQEEPEQQAPGDQDDDADDDEDRSDSHCGVLLTPRRTGNASEIAAQRLLALDRLEESLEVPLAERRRAVPLDHLEEERRPVLRGLREDLQQVAVLVAVGEDPQPPQVTVVLVDLADALLDVLVIGVGCVEELEPALLHRRDGRDDVLRLERDVLDAGAAVELEVLVDLALPLPLGRLVDRELDLAAAVRHHLRHERRVLGLDLVVAEVDDVRHPEDALVELDPVVHPAELDVADDVVERAQSDARPSLAVFGRSAVAGEVRPRVLAAVDERVDRVAVGADRGELDAAELVLDPVRLGDPACAALDGRPVRVPRACDLERDDLRAVAVRTGEARDLAVRSEAARQDEADVALLDDVGRAVAHARL